MIQDQANLTLEGMEALKAYMGGQDPDAASNLTKSEKEADEARRILIDELNKTFVTPFDRLEEHPGVSNDHAQRAKALENRVEEVYREALADLFSGVEDIQHVVKMLKLREVYRHLSNAADRGDEAANVIADIVVKIT
jgi:uncharacterized protein Yka (UPF0111/DUF47 family)